MPAVANLYSRSVELLPEDDPARSQLLPDLGVALEELGDLAGAERVFAEALDRASVMGDRRLESVTLLQQLRLRSHVDPEYSFQQGLRLAEDAVESFEALGDDPGLAEAWLSVAMFRFWTGHASAAEAACDLAVRHARDAGNRRTEAQALSWLVLAISEGPAEVTAGLQRLVRILEAAEGHSEVEARVLCTRAEFQAMLGRFDAAREAVARSRELFEDLGLITDMAGDLPVVAGRVELLAGDPAAAERVLRWGYAILERMGETSFLSTVAGYLANAVYDQDRLGEALQLTETCEETASPEDWMSQILWRSARAKIVARRGEFEAAQRMASEAVEIAERTDYTIFHAGALVASADVLRLAGQPDAAASAAARALRLFEQKGDAVSAGRTRVMIERLGRVE
jgi:tetratricopeptide (TPR) repeat protein